MSTSHNARGMLSRSTAVALPERVSEKPRNINIYHQVFRRVLLGLVLVPTLLIWVAIGTGCFGYRVINAQGTSMEPTLRNGDALWVEQLDVANVKVGDIVTLGSGTESITHRVMKIEPVLSNSYLVFTKGDANLLIEEWEISGDKTVSVLVARVPFGGYVLAFLDSIPGRILLIGTLSILTAILLKRRLSHGMAN